MLFAALNGILCSELEISGTAHIREMVFNEMQCASQFDVVYSCKYPVLSYTSNQRIHLINPVVTT